MCILIYSQELGLALRSLLHSNSRMVVLTSYVIRLYTVIYFIIIHIHVVKNRSSGFVMQNLRQDILQNSSKGDNIKLSKV